MGDSEEPLLAHANEDALWDLAEQGHDEGAPLQTFTVGELLRDNPNRVIGEIQARGVRKTDVFDIEDDLILSLVGDDSIVTAPSETAHVHSPTFWHEHLEAIRNGGKSPNKGVGRRLRRMSSSRAVRWKSTIPVVSYVVAIEHAASPDSRGLLRPLLRRWQEGGCRMDVFELPAVQAVIDYKWTRYCRNVLMWQLGIYLIWMLSFFGFTVVFQDEDTAASLAELLSSARGRATVALDLLSLVAMAPFLVIEAASVASWGFWGWLSLWNIIDILTYSFQLGISTLHLTRVNVGDQALSVVASAQCVLLLFRLQYFSRVFKATRFAFVDDLVAVVSDIKYYLAFLALVTAGWGVAFHILFRADQESHPEFSSIGITLVTMVDWLMGNYEVSGLTSSTNPVAASILGIGFSLILGTVLMNLLIGILTNSLERVTSDEGIRMQLSKAQAIDEIDAVLPEWLEDKLQARYGLYPRFIHVLRVDPDRLDRVQRDSIWGNEQGANLNGGDEGGPAGGGGASSHSVPTASASASHGGSGSADITGAGGAAVVPSAPAHASDLAAKVDALTAQIEALSKLVERLADGQAATETAEPPPPAPKGTQRLGRK